MRMEGKIRHWVRVNIWSIINGCNKYGKWGDYELNVYPLRRRVYFILYSGCNIIDGLVGVLTLGSYCPELVWKLVLNKKIDKWKG